MQMFSAKLLRKIEVDGFIIDLHRIDHKTLENLIRREIRDQVRIVENIKTLSPEALQFRKQQVINRLYIK